MLSFKTYAFLFLVFVQTSRTLGEVQFATPLNFVHLAENPDALSGHQQLKTHEVALSNAAAELLKLKYYKDDPSPQPKPELYSFAHQQTQAGVTRPYLFYMVVFKAGTKFVSMGVLITEDEEVHKQISVLEYYFGYNVSACIIHRLWLENVQKMDEIERVDRDRDFTDRLRGMLFLGYAAAINKWKSVKTATKNDGIDFNLKNIYLGVKKYSIIAAAELKNHFHELKGLEEKLSIDFEEVSTVSGQVTQVSPKENSVQKGDPSLPPSKTTDATGKFELTVLKYLCQTLPNDGGIQFGFIINVKEKYVLGVTVVIEKDVTAIASFSSPQDKPEEKFLVKITSSIKSEEDPQGNLNGYNVFLQKLQSVAIFLQKTENSVQILKEYKEEIFGEKRILQKDSDKNICLAKFALTVSPWPREEIWMGLKYEFFSADQMTLPNGIGLDPKNLTEQEQKYSYWRSTDPKVDPKVGNSNWNTIMELTKPVPKMTSGDILNSDAEKGTWVKAGNEFLDTKDDTDTIRRNKPVWKGIDFSSVAEDKSKQFPHGFLPADKSGLFRDGENPAVDNVYLLRVKDPWGKLVLTPDRKHRLDTLLGQRNGPPNYRAFNGGFVDIDEIVEKLLSLVQEKIRALFVKEICLLNVIKEFMEESFRSTEMKESDEEELWRKYVELLLLANADQIGIYKIFDAATGDQRNRHHSFVTVHAYAFIIYDHPELEDLLSEENLYGGDDSVETARVNFRTNMHMFANHPLFSYRAIHLYNSVQYPGDTACMGTYKPVRIQVRETEPNEPDTAKGRAKNHTGEKVTQLVAYYNSLYTQGRR